MQKSQDKNEQFSSPCVDNSKFSEENNSSLTENSENEPETPENTEKATDFQANSAQSSGLSAQNANTDPKSYEGADNLSLEGQIERDFKDFEIIYPNISKNSLLSDEGLRIFSEGKENKPLSVVYAQYKQLVAKISSEAIKQEQIRQNNANSSVGGLSSANSGDDGYFTREQVLKMSRDEIKRNYKRIRQSQARW